MEVSAKKRLLVLASGPVSPNLAQKLGPILASNIPFSNSLSLILLLQEACKKYSNIYVSLDHTKLEIGKLLVDKFENVEIFYCDSKNSFSEIIYKFINRKKVLTGKIDILFGDTLKTSLFDLDFEKDLMFVAHTKDSANWDKAKRNNNQVLEIIQKSEECDSSNAITGGFRILDIQVFNQLLSINMNKPQQSQKLMINTFYETLKDYDKLPGHEIQIIEDKVWVDLGHLDTYFSERRKVIFSGFRSFNSGAFDFKYDQVVKKGTVDKIINEVYWFTQVPVSIHKYIPNFTEGQTPDTYATQYIEHLPMSDSWISENNETLYWEYFIVALEEFLVTCGKYKNDEPTKSQEILKYSMFVTKLETRFLSLLDHLGDRLDVSAELKINEIQMPSIEKIFQVILSIGEEASKVEGWNLIHGDLCFSNILFNREAHDIKLIDPRGSFGKKSIFGDPIYELLKISQCALGDYDYLAADLYSLKILGNEIEMRVPNPGSHKEIKSLFKAYLDKKSVQHGFTYDKLRILEAGLFLSAAPLHTESNRALALLAKACLLVEEGL